MKKVNFLLILAFIASATTIAGPPGSGWSLTWSDEFNGNSLNSSKWSAHDKLDYDKYGRRCEFKPGNCTVGNGRLTIENNAQNTVFTGGWVESKTKFQYGYFEARVRINWWHQRIWPTFWVWEWGHTNEFDVMEFAAGHIYPSQSHHHCGSKTSEVSTTKLDEWHTWGLLWTYDEVSFYIDDVKIFTSNNPACARNLNYPILFTSSPNRELQPSQGTSLPEFWVDWVRYHEGGNPGSGGGSEVSFKGNNNKYVSSENGTKGMMCNRSAIGAWEKFTVVDAGGGKKALKGSNGKYVSSENGSKAMMCNRSSIGDWEKFTINHLGNNVYTLKGNNGKYVSSENGSKAMMCNRSSVGAWEKFTVPGGLKNAEINQAYTKDITSLKVNAYPNPITNGTVGLNLSLAEESAITIRIFDNSGKLISSENIGKYSYGSHELNFNTNELNMHTSGLYILQVISKDAIESTKILVE